MRNHGRYPEDVRNKSEDMMKGCTLSALEHGSCYYDGDGVQGPAFDSVPMIDKAVLLTTSAPR